MDLTMSGLLVDRAETIVYLYADLLDWTAVKETWHNERMAERGSRSSSQKIFRVIRDRFQAAGPSLPTVPQVARLYDACETERDKAQLTYLYLVQGDPLVRFQLHELFRDQGIERSAWDLHIDRLEGYLNSFTSEDGSQLDYAESTLERWVQGFRSVLHSIGARDSPYANEGQPPPLGRIPLLVAAGHSWEQAGDDWQQEPLGWIYLFQPRAQWDPLFSRLSREPTWSARELRNEVRLEPSSDPFVLESKEVDHEA